MTVASRSTLIASLVGNLGATSEAGTAVSSGIHRRPEASDSTSAAARAHYNAMWKFVGLSAEQTAEVTESVDAIMSTFASEYDATAAQLTLSSAKSQATAAGAGGQLAARPPASAAPAAAPTSPTSATRESSMRMSSRPKVALKTVSLGVLHSGWLTKKGAVRKNWKHRWFEMSPDFTLRYFDKESEPRQEKGVVVLYNCKVDAGVTEDEHENCIALRPAVLPGRTYYFAAARSHEVDEWLPFMRAACQLSRHPSSPVPAKSGAFYAAYARTAESIGGPISGAVRPSRTLDQFHPLLV